MSVKCMTAVFEHSRATLGARLVLLAIADYAQDDGSNAYPSVPTLARKAMISERAVQYAVNALIESGELAREPRAGNKGNTSNMYSVILPGLGGVQYLHRVKEASPGVVQNLHQGGAKSAPGGVQLASPDPLSDPSEGKNDPPIPPSGDGALDIFWQAFWQKYPRKSAKADALKAWAKLNPDRPLAEAIIAAVILASGTEQWQRDNGAYIPYPATYLNGRRWEDEPAAHTTEPRRAIPPRWL